LLLIEADTKVYDTFSENMVVKLKLKDDTWVNYKGKKGHMIKISNFFGKDQEYPSGIFSGYVAIESVLDTARREEYAELRNFSIVRIETYDKIESPAPRPKSFKSEGTDIGGFYIGMPKVEALAISKPSLSIGSHRYALDLDFSTTGYLSALIVTGTQENALAVESKIKEQVDELNNLLIDKYGYPNNIESYPSFLEIESGNVFQYAYWYKSGKIVSLGIGEQNDLYYPIVKVKER